MDRRSGYCACHRPAQNGFPCGTEDVGRIDPRFSGPLEVIFQPEDFPPERGDVLHIHAHATSIFEDSALDALTRGANDHIEPALLARTPDVGRFAAQGSFFEVTDGHRIPGLARLFLLYLASFNRLC